MDNHVSALLPKVKANLILTPELGAEDDGLIRGYILAALDYAMSYQKLEKIWKKIPPVTEQAVILLVTHWYESRDGSTGGFFADTASAANNVMETVQRLLEINKENRR